MRRSLLRCATLLLLLAAARPSPAAEPPAALVPWEGPAVSAFLQALERGDDAAMIAAVTASDADPVAIAYGAWLARLDSPGGPAAAAQAARAVVRRSRHGPTTPEFEALVETWIGLDEAGRARERQRAEFALSVARKRLGEAHAEVRAAVEAALSDLTGAPRSPPAVFLLLLRLGALLGLGADTDETVAAMELGLARAHALPWPESTARILEGRSGLERKRGRVADGLVYLERALEHGAERLAPETHARLRWRRADALSRLRRFEEAIVETRAAAELYRAAGDGAAQAGALGTEARAWRGLGRFEEATTAGTRARQSALAAGNARESARSLVLLALLASDAGRLAVGLSLLEQALAEAEPLGDASDDLLSHVLTNLGQTEINIGNLDAAIAHVSRALEIRRRARDVPGALAAARTLAHALDAAGRPDEASRQMLAVAEAAAQAGLHRERGRALVALGRARLDAGDAARALVAADDALAAFRASLGVRPTPVDWASAESCGALALLALGRTPEGLARARTALERSAGVGEGRRAVTRSTLALALLRSGDASGALAELRLALDASRLRAAGIGDADPEALGQVVRRTTELAVRAALLLPADEAAGAAFPFIEAGRASILAAALVQRDTLLAARLPVALYAEERASREAVDEALESLGRVSAGTGSRRSAEVEAARQALDAADRRRTEALARIGREAHNAVELLDPPRPTLADLRGLLQEREAYVAFHVADDDQRRALVALVATRSAAALVDLGDASDLLDRASAWIDLVSAPGSQEAKLAAWLYDRLLRPLESALVGTERWIVSPDGALSFLPWGALRRADGATSTRLVERVELALVPSVGVLRYLRDPPLRPRGRGVLAVADPTPGPGARGLPASREEVAAIAALHPLEARTVLVGDEATVATLRVRLAGIRGRLAAVHWATHGAFDPSRPRLSGLLLARGERLYFDDVASLRVDADLAVLAGCETAQGALREGEGVLGLVRAFFLAGCPRVVASSWRVSDTSTKTLMVRFHEHMTKDGSAPAAALRAAQLERLRAGGEASHPYHWAAFQCWGLPE